MRTSQHKNLRSFFYRVRIEKKLDHLHELVHMIIERFDKMEQELQRLSDDIGSLTDVVIGAEALLDKLAAMVAAIPSTDPATIAKIKELADGIEATKADLAASVAKNTPAEPQP